MTVLSSVAKSGDAAHNAANAKIYVFAFISIYTLRG